MSRVRCKFKLNTVTERIGSRAIYEEKDGKRVHAGYQDCTFWDAEFSAVSGGAGDENQSFWDYTPGGTFKLSTINRMPWTIGKEYYLDILPAGEAG